MTKFHRIATALLWVGAAIVVGFLFARLTDRVNVAEDKADASAAANQSAVTAVTDLAAQVRSLGAQPVVEPSELPDPVVGTPGAAGSPGANGLTGLQGLQGPRGLTGATGPAGPAGVAGAAITGPAGPAGPKGDTGPIGPAGPAGANGADGKAGTDGAAGAVGPVGPAGYPDSLAVTIAGVGFLCTDPDGDHAYTCEAASP